MRRTLIALTLFASPLLAQQPQGKESDPTIKVKSTGLPAGWTLRLDDGAAKRYTVDDTRFEAMGSGLHVTSGPAAIYYNPKDQAKGSFTATATFGQRVAPPHPEAYGLFVGGSKLETKDQQYLYFLVRGTGEYYIAHRAGADPATRAMGPNPSVHTLVPWTASDAVKKQDEKGAASNTLAIQATADSVHMMVNGQRVKSFAKSEMHGFNTDGQVGLRVNHNLNVHIGGFEVKK